MRRLTMVGLGLMAGLTQAMELTSPDVHENQMLKPAQVYSGSGCNGGNTLPTLSWRGAPADTKSYAITVYDPDAPTGSGWWHWVAYDIPATASSVSADKLPAGMQQGRTDFGTKGFGGACPPPGDKPHRYIFTVYALKVEKLGAPADASAAMVGFMLHNQQLDSATITAKYSR